MIEDIGLSDFFELTPDLVWIAGTDGYLRNANPAVTKNLGYSLEELLSKPITAFMHPDDTGITVENRNKLLKGEVLHSFSNRYISKTGNIIWLEWTSVYLAQREVVLAIAKDITYRKKIEIEVEEKYIKFRGLATHFKNMVENDRKYFAHELHEELAQLLAVVNMDVSWLNMHAENLPDKVKSRVEHASEVCKLMINTIQKLAFSISPQMLDDFGLSATMEWLCNEFYILYGIVCSFESDYDENDLTNEIKLDFFRICQEAFADILNHAQAGKIKVSIKDTGISIELLIHDSGSGFAIELLKQSNGLASIQERANSINAKITLIDNLTEGIAISLVVEKQYSAVISS